MLKLKRLEFKENMLTRSVLCKLFQKGGDIIGSQMRAFISRETQRNILMVMIITEVQKFELSRRQAFARSGFKLLFGMRISTVQLNTLKAL